MAAGSAHDTDRKSDLAVMDANEYKQKRRLERILDAMDNIPDQADRAKVRYFDGEIDHHARCVLVQDAVKDAIWEAWNLLVDHENKCQRQAETAEDDEDVWPHSEYFVGHPDEAPLGVIEQSHSDDLFIWGLRDFFETDEMWVERWDEQEKPRNAIERTVPHEEKHTIPREVSWAAALHLKEFLNQEHDMEITFETMEQDVDADPF